MNGIVGRSVYVLPNEVALEYIVSVSTFERHYRVALRVHERVRANEEAASPWGQISVSECEVPSL